MSDLNEQLSEVGLSGKESEIYIALLEYGPIGGGKLAKILKMDRTHTYNLLSNLINKGLAGHILKDKKTLFRAESPKHLLNEIKKKEQIIKRIMPKLESLEKISPKFSSVNVLEGKSGLRTMSQILLNSKAREILVFGGTGKSYNMLKYEMPHIAKRTESLKMNGRIITSEELRRHPLTKLKNFKIKYVKETVPSSTMIFGDKISINIFDENPSIILIENKSVAESYRKYFVL